MMVMPRYLACCTSFSIWSCRVYWPEWCWVAFSGYCQFSHCLVLNSILPFVSQVWSCLISTDLHLVAQYHCMIRCTGFSGAQFVSSTQTRIVVHLDIWSAMIRNGQEPRTNPWGTLTWHRHVEDSPFSTTHCSAYKNLFNPVQSGSADTWDMILLSAWRVVPNFCRRFQQCGIFTHRFSFRSSTTTWSLFPKMWWSTLSNAFAKSSMRTSVYSPSSRLPTRCETSSRSCVSQNLPFWKSCWFGLSILCSLQCLSVMDTTMCSRNLKAMHVKLILIGQ